MPFPAGVTEEFPFDQETLVYKVMGRIFAITNIDNFESVNLKCDPEKAVELRETHEEVLPGFHMNKKHWNTVIVEGSIPNSLLTSWIKDSYKLVVKKLPKKVQKDLTSLWQVSIFPKNIYNFFK